MTNTAVPLTLNKMLDKIEDILRAFEAQANALYAENEEMIQQHDDDVKRFGAIREIVRTTLVTKGLPWNINNQILKIDDIAKEGLGE